MLIDFPKGLREGDYPTCAICKKPVDEFEVYDEPASFEQGRVFTARCHGQVERVRVTDQDMRAMMMSGQSRFYMGEAFVPKGSAVALRTLNEVQEESIDRARKRLMGNPGFR
jgi:hypothetical protein